MDKDLPAGYHQDEAIIKTGYIGIPYMLITIKSVVFTFLAKNYNKSVKIVMYWKLPDNAGTQEEIFYISKNDIYELDGQQWFKCRLLPATQKVEAVSFEVIIPKLNGDATTKRVGLYSIDVEIAEDIKTLISENNTK